VAWVDSRPKSCPERVVANNLRGEILGSVVRIRWQIARPIPRF
jgi:hypothetical protein